MAVGKAHTPVDKTWTESPWKTVAIPDNQASGQNTRM